MAAEEGKTPRRRHVFTGRTSRRTRTKETNAVDGERLARRGSGRAHAAEEGGRVDEDASGERRIGSGDKIGSHHRIIDYDYV